MSVFNKRREFVRFILVGVLATATHYGIYFFFMCTDVTSYCIYYWLCY